MCYTSVILRRGYQFNVKETSELSCLVVGGSGVVVVAVWVARCSAGRRGVIASVVVVAIVAGVDGRVAMSISSIGGRSVKRSMNTVASLSVLVDGSVLLLAAE